MKYAVGDLINTSEPGLGYIAKITQDFYDSITIHIVWFCDQREYPYGECNIDSWIKDGEATHYPVGNQ